jgi:hypothetical protein
MTGRALIEKLSINTTLSTERPWASRWRAISSAAKPPWQ